MKRRASSSSIGSSSLALGCIKGLNEIAGFIARDSEVFARLLIERVFLTTQRLAEFPTSGRVVPEDPTGEVREVIVGNYRVIYRVAGDKVQISSVIHGAREINIEDVPSFEAPND